MVALPLMAKLAVALKPDARLILLGDRDQLASVEAGAVLGDICGRGRQERFSPGFGDVMARVAGERLPAELIGGSSGPLVDSLVILRKNYRFEAGSGIGTVAGAINAGDGAAALAQLGQDASGRTWWRPLPSIDGLKKALAGKVIAGYKSYLDAGTPEEALKGFDAFRVLCALRRGPYGVSGINILIEEILAEEGLIDLRSRWYRGRPLMIVVNDYNLKLFNGDIGIVLPEEDAGGTPRVCFPAPEGGVRKIAPVRLPAHETVFAMTVHKSQGSELDRVLLLLPDHDAEHLTRELVYTGVTRARREVEVWGDETAFLNAVRKRSERNSGLEEILWMDSES
jgi:exodeoxyribonuclease V alpha subunit